MQKMSGGDGDTHDHGPPSKAPDPPPRDSLRRQPPYAQLAVWSTNLSGPGVNSAAGAMAGVASGIVTCPLDVIKTKLQAQGSFRNLSGPSGVQSGAIYRGMMGTARTIIRQDGVRGMYRGLGPMLLGYLPTWAVYMAVYDSSREYFFQNGYKTEKEKFMARVFASLTAGACSTLVTNPIWVIKTRLMSQVSRTASDGARTPWHYTSTLDAARKMYRAEGVAAFYSGLTPALLGLTHVAIQFPLYEYFKQQFTGLEMGETPTTSGNEGTNTVGILAATFLSKVCATSATYPHEVLRTRMQTQQRHAHPESSPGVTAANNHSQSVSGKNISNTDGGVYRPRYSGIVASCKMILREEGWRAFYNGMGTNMVRAVPAAMTTMLTFETVKSLIIKAQEDGRELLREQEN